MNNSITVSDSLSTDVIFSKLPALVIDDDRIHHMRVVKCGNRVIITYETNLISGERYILGNTSRSGKTLRLACIAMLKWLHAHEHLNQPEVNILDTMLHQM